ncbi:MAG: glycosyltransferase [Myxococcales bacterium]|jgi:glycosyltransferase involved in cell wall biosynthesis
MSPRHSIQIVVPCYNEASRLDGEALLQFAEEHPGTGFVLVDDGSTDGTLELLQSLAQRNPAQLAVVRQPENRGKAEAVRAGMRHAFDGGCEMVGYWDADLATPLDEIPRFVATLREHSQRVVVFGARVQLLGRSIRRSRARHYLGRVFATATSALLRLPVYDTQCGAKLFRATPMTRALFNDPFAVGWTFDVELIARMICVERESSGRDVADLIYELPLQTWHDVAGSKVKPSDFLRGVLELLRIHRRYIRGRWSPALPHETRAATEPHD